MKAYYFAEGGQQKGPFPVEDLARQGVRPETLIWAEGMPNWVAAQTVPEVAAAMTPAQPQPQHQPQAYPQHPAPPQSPAYPQQPGYPPAAYGAPAGQPYPPANQPVGYAGPATHPQYAQPGQYPPPNFADANGKKLAAGLLAIFLGGFGIHKFILGFTGAGVVYIVVGVVLGFFTCGITTGVMGIIALIEGIIYLTKSDADFYQQYMVEKKQWF